jgi:spoIIIJ-associated protein
LKKVVATGKSIEDAVRAGLAQLNTTEDKVIINVLEQPSKGLFGLLGSREAKVELERVPDPLEETIGFMQEVFKAMELNVDIEAKHDNEGVVLNLSGNELGMLIGRRGQTLDALQFLANIVANRFSQTHLRYVLDAEDFRDRRRKTLEDLSMRLASRVVRTRKEVVLEPMTPQERKVIHSQLQGHPSVKTYSKGEDPNRRVIICLK